MLTKPLAENVNAPEDVVSRLSCNTILLLHFISESITNVGPGVDFNSFNGSNDPFNTSDIFPFFAGSELVFVFDPFCVLSSFGAF